MVFVGLDCIGWTFGGDADGTLQVGPPQSGAVPAVAVHYLRMGVMEHIEPPAGDDHVPRAHRAEEVRMTGSAAAVMRGFEDRRFEGGVVRHQIPLGFCGDVPRQQHAERSVFDFPDHRQIVADPRVGGRRLLRDEIRCGMEQGQAHLADLPGASRLQGEGDRVPLQ